MPSLSVIVPVFNTEKYLQKCLNSLENLEDTEIVIINDGSTDGSEDIINEYRTERDKGTLLLREEYPQPSRSDYKEESFHKLKNNINIVYYKKENTGIADTRNFGIEHSTGDYILFVDSDDYIEPDLVSTLAPYMREKIDVIKFKLQRVDENGNCIEKIDGAIFEKVSGEEAFERLYPSDVLLDSPCVYLFRREYLKQNNFKFQVGTYHEDFGLIPLIIIKAKTVVSTDFYGYNYLQSTNSITRNEDYNKTIKKMEDALKQYDNMVMQIEKYEISKRAKENIKIFFTNAIILKLKELKEPDQDRFIDEIKKRKMVSNIKIRNLKQLLKRILLLINIKTYLKKR